LKSGRLEEPEVKGCEHQDNANVRHKDGERVRLWARRYVRSDYQPKKKKPGELEARRVFYCYPTLALSEESG
jgi:hypothetical protein